MCGQNCGVAALSLALRSRGEVGRGMSRGGNFPCGTLWLRRDSSEAALPLDWISSATRAPETLGEDTRASSCGVCLLDSCLLQLASLSRSSGRRTYQSGAKAPAPSSPCEPAVRHSSSHNSSSSWLPWRNSSLGDGFLLRIFTRRMSLQPRAPRPSPYIWCSPVPNPLLAAKRES